MAFSADSFLSQSLQKRKDTNALRQLQSYSDLVDFCSNDYLGYACSAELAESIESELSSIGDIRNGSGGSRLLAGNTVYAEDLEKRIAAFHNSEAGLIYNSGYDANVGLFSSLGQKGATFIYDELIHASMHDGIKMSSASGFMFRHNDISHLEERLKAATGIVYVAVESIYSMDGDECMLIQILSLCKKYDANLIVDEAHATGVTRNEGKGLVQLHSVEKEVFARIHTFGKALGCHGAIILGSNLLRDYLINFSRSFIYTTAIPIHSLVTINCAYNKLKVDAVNIEQLHRLIEHFRKKAAECNGIELIPSKSPIQCLIVPGNAKVKKVASDLRNKGFDVRPILNPTVAKGRERLRICLHVFNTEEQIDSLLHAVCADLQTNNS